MIYLIKNIQIGMSVVNRIVSKFTEIESVKDLPRQGRLQIPDDKIECSTSSLR